MRSGPRWRTVTDGADAAEPGHGLLRALLWFAAFVGLGFAGRATAIDGQTFTFVWPAAAPAVGWWLTVRSMRWRWIALGLAVGTAVFTLTTGVDPSIAGIVALGSVLVASVTGPAVVWIRDVLALPDPRWRLHSTADGWALVAGTAIGTLVSAGVTSGGIGLVVGHWTIMELLAWWTTIFAAVIVLLPVPLFVAEHLGASAARGDRAASLLAPVGRLLARRWSELLLLIVTSALLYRVAFVWFSDLPIVFLLLIPSLWVGMRFDPLVAGLHTFAVSTLTVILTLRGEGPFVGVGTDAQNAVVVQSLIGLLAMITVFSSLSRQERRELMARLAVAQGRDHDRATLLTTVVDTIQDGVALVDDTGRVLFGNPAGRRLIGVGRERWPDLEVWAIAARSPDGREVTEEDLPFHQVFTAKTPIVQDLLITPLDGSEDRLLEITMNPVKETAESTATQAVVILRDVADERAQTDALQSFAAIAAHDLSNPLGLVMGWTELAEEALSDGDPDPAAVASYLARIRGASESMHDLIKDLLALSMSQDSALEFVDVDLAEVAAAVAQLRARDADPAPEISVGAIPKVYGEPTLLRQVIDNLVGNALKYVEPGERPEIRIGGRIRSDGWVEVSVSDRGIGIPEDQRDRVFLAFRRAHPSAYPGHGLGLAICRTIVERHGGTITAGANPDRIGTRIVFRLPAADRVAAQSG